MNPNIPVSYYQTGSVSISHGSKILNGYKTKWVTDSSVALPKVGSVFTLDKSDYYVIENIVDDEKIILNREFTGQSQTYSSYMIANKMDAPVDPDDEEVINQLVELAKKFADLAHDWAVGPSGTSPDTPSDTNNAKYYSDQAKSSADSISDDVAQAKEAAKQAKESEENAAASEAAAKTSETNSANSASAAAASEAAAKTSETNSANSASAAAASEAAAKTSETNSANSASAAAASEAAAKTSETNSKISETNAKTSEANAATSENKSHDWAVGPSGTSPDTPSDTNNSKYHSSRSKAFAVGPNPSPPLDEPSDTNNSYYYFQQVLGLTSGAIAFNDTFTPSAAKEYPDKTASSSLWVITTSDPDGYTFTTGNMAGILAKTGDWFFYYKKSDAYEVMRVSPLHNQSISQATEDIPGIAKIAKNDDVDSGTDDLNFITALKLAYALGKLTAADVGARPDDWTPSAADVGARPDDWMPSAADVGARPDDWMPSAADVGAVKKSGDTMNGSLAIESTGDVISIHYPDVGHGYFKGYRGGSDDFYFGRASDSAPGVSWSNYNSGAAIHIQDSGEIQYNSAGSGQHIFNSIITGTHFITHRTTYPSIRVSGDTGSYGMMELDSVGKNLNLISRNDDGSNRNVWYFKDDGYVKSNKGFETDQYTEGNAYVDQAATGAPFYVGTLTSKASDSAYFPAIKWKSKPSTGKWLTSSIGHILSSGGIDATILTHCDESGADLSVWEFKRPTGDFVSPGNVVAYSDERIKKDIKPIENALEKVKAINGVSYTRTDSGAKQVGVIAQEVEKVLPEVVSTSENLSLNIKDFKGVAYGNITALLIEAIKDLDKKVESLSSRLSKYEDI